MNDVTHAELQLLLQRASHLGLPRVEEALRAGDLSCLDSGQSSPCLDLAKLNKQVADAMVERRVDLLVLEGMGRAVHTNLYAGKFDKSLHSLSHKTVRTEMKLYFQSSNASA